MPDGKFFPVVTSNQQLATPIIIVPMTKAGPWRTALSNNRFTAKMTLIDSPCPSRPQALQFRNRTSCHG